MLASVITSSIPSPDLSTLLLRGNGRQFQRTRAKKLQNRGEASKMDGPISSFRVSKNFLAKSAVAVFGLGFLDAGYSGDWSRIGVISKESEELLKVAAYFVIPFCLFIAFSLSEEDKVP